MVKLALNSRIAPRAVRAPAPLVTAIVRPPAPLATATLRAPAGALAGRLAIAALAVVVVACGAALVPLLRAAAAPSVADTAGAARAATADAEHVRIDRADLEGTGHQPPSRDSDPAALDREAAASARAGRSSTAAPAGEALRAGPAWGDVPPADRARARALGAVLTELSRRQVRGRARSGRGAAARADEPEREWADLRTYLTHDGERPAEVRPVEDILDAPSNVVVGDDAVSLVAWDARDQEPRGSYLYVVEQGPESLLAQVHRYFCVERRLDVLAEVCVPIASVFSDAGRPMAVTYASGAGEPVPRVASDLDPATFSREARYVEANELLRSLQRYFDERRG
jgi:hypothetical protein